MRKGTRGMVSACDAMVCVVGGRAGAEVLTWSAAILGLLGLLGLRCAVAVGELLLWRRLVTLCQRRERAGAAMMTQAY